MTDIHRLDLSIWDLLKISVATRFYGLVLPGGSTCGIAVRCSQLSTHERNLAAGISLLADQAVATAAMGSVGLVFWLGDDPGRSPLSGATIIAALSGVMLLLTAVLSPARIRGILPIRLLITRLGDRG